MKSYAYVQMKENCKLVHCQAIDCLFSVNISLNYTAKTK